MLKGTKDLCKPCPWWSAASRRPSGRTRPYPGTAPPPPRRHLRRSLPPRLRLGRLPLPGAVLPSRARLPGRSGLVPLPRPRRRRPRTARRRRALGRQPRRLRPAPRQPPASSSPPTATPRAGVPRPGSKPGRWRRASPSSSSPPHTATSTTTSPPSGRRRWPRGSPRSSAPGAGRERPRRRAADATGRGKCHTRPMRFFNTEGPVRPDDHYAIPSLDRVDVDELLALIRAKRYFVLFALDSPPRMVNPIYRKAVPRELGYVSGQPHINPLYYQYVSGATKIRGNSTIAIPIDVWGLSVPIRRFSYRKVAESGLRIRIRVIFIGK